MFELIKLTLTKLLVVTLILLGIPTPNQNISPPTTNLGSFYVSGGGTYRLQTSIGTTNTSVNLTSFKEPVSNIPYTMSYLNSSIAYGTLDPQTNKSEFVSFTGITQNADGSAQLTGVIRGLSRSFPYTASTTLRQRHSGQSIFILSNAPQVYYEYAAKQNAESITAVWTFASTTIPKLDAYVAPTLDAEFAPKKYADDLAIAGSPDATETVKGISELATGTEIASSTSAGGTSARLVIPASLSTSTPTLTGHYVPVSENDGKLSQSWFDLTEDYTWTGIHTFATTTIATSTITNLIATSATVGGKDVSEGLSKFGGDGSDGALALTTGTTTIDLGNVKIFVKNYTSISITGGAAIEFSNPNTEGTIILLRSQGDVTMTATSSPNIDATAMGGAGGSGGIANNNGNDGSSGNGNIKHVDYGSLGTKGTGGGPHGSGGVGGDIVFPVSDLGGLAGYIVKLHAGGGGGGAGGGAAGGVGGDGGNGGGALLVECGGSLNFSGKIFAKGENGDNGTVSTNAGGGGGAGGGGTAIVLYNSLTANTGTITVTGGSKGLGGNIAATYNGGGGGGGASANNNGDNGSAGDGSGGGDGGDGGDGISMVAENIEF